MRPFDARRVLIGVAGGIAAYKTVELARRLRQKGAEVQIILTENGARFVGPTTFEAVTARPVRQSMWEKNALDHIALGAWADAIVVAPATANLLAKLANGLANDMLSSTLLAAPRRSILAPAMNTRMYEHPATQRNLERLREDGHVIVGPAYGELAEGEEGWGRMVEPEMLLAHVGRALEWKTRWRDKKVVVTAGPTWEPVDTVRFLGNRSSGRMGQAIAAAAWRRGADVVLINGPGHAATPPELDNVHLVESTEQMAEAVNESAADADAIFMVAAVADYRPARPEDRKIRRSEGLTSIEVEPTADVMAAAAKRARAECVKVAFAVESGEDAVESAKRKLREKGAHLVALNDPSQPGAAFDVDTNRVSIIDAQGGVEELPLLLKTEVADELLDRAEGFLPGD
ncbi:MAG: bifunctional phosphopantothenoylcysteine decarboxylase/phosphopantothenate--cysteine ligase CoaBC [Gemmatimonadetes bacterium]|uniref:Coenzyme A biosynthesis bifunctional protein CoaBC n=1 Tax=Candidatus Kutchimonas denitrificans TaxID=3056748 RepID=A0AAE5CC37_9BACT|nr:bifunctional phosphopantothenoylcysteine decarboxylase/phosphopantothenate--cysteine ligase CoaBC [Gemmatimonadota bacterium]NIR75180.1 bifunctional phosphopantothenoylcysteine decarboxylase/phosphopantothenate--cysteine ligase CoaBC [Candidatus Kutchimonas denitrificans]NIS00118.1 bifunctional phosphopantothenoylcysteine decarboxylase/phosphopantothenate--cysteine ligase CoaBC [Gemmatimonadota bacterium]NIT65710.1 bifunctional phosphopantothenoylcysteine decarboxylase/phosphopantothenate--cy